MKKDKVYDITYEKCFLCGNDIVYSEKYDCHYCPKCLYWTETICPSRKCIYCKNRPKYPKAKDSKKDKEKMNKEWAMLFKKEGEE